MHRKSLSPIRRLSLFVICFLLITFFSSFTALYAADNREPKSTSVSVETIDRSEAIIRALMKDLSDSRRKSGVFGTVSYEYPVVDKLSQIGIPAIPFLVDVANDKKETHTRRCNAIKALGRMKEVTPEMISTLRAALYDDAQPICCEAAEALSLKGPAAAPAVDDLIILLRKPNVGSQRIYVVKALEAIGPEAGKAVPALEELAAFYKGSRDSSAGYIRQKIENALATIRLEKIQKRLSHLETLRDDSKASNRARAAIELGVIVPLSQEAIQALQKATRDSDWRVRISAVVALSKIDAITPSLMRTFMNRLADDNKMVRYNTTIVVKRFIEKKMIDSANNDWRQALGERLADDFKVIREYAAYLLAQRDFVRDSEETDGHLPYGEIRDVQEALETDDRALVKKNIIRLIDTIRPKIQRIIETKTNDPNHSLSRFQLLIDIADTTYDAVVYLIHDLKSDDPAMQLFAIQSLEKIGVVAQEARPALSVASGGPVKEVADAAINALTHITLFSSADAKTKDVQPKDLELQMTVKKLIEQLPSDYDNDVQSVKTRKEIQENIKELGEPVFNELISLSRENILKDDAILEVVGSFAERANSAVSQLEKMLNDRDYHGGDEAIIKTLATIGTDDATDVLAEALKQYFSRSKILKELERIGWSPKTERQIALYCFAKGNRKEIISMGETAVPVLMDLLNGEETLDYKEPMYILGMMEAKARMAVPTLVNVIKREKNDSDIVLAGVYALVKINDPRGADAVREIIQDPYVPKRQFLVEKLFEPIFSSSDYYRGTPINITKANSRLLLPIDERTIMLIINTFRDANGNIVIEKKAIYSFLYRRKIKGYYRPAKKIIRLLERLGPHAVPALPLLRDISKGDFESEIREAAQKALKKIKTKTIGKQ